MTDGTAFAGNTHSVDRWRRGIPGIRRWLLLFSLLFAIVAISACATSEKRQFARDLNPVIGKANKAYFIEKYGEPDKRTAVDTTTDVWEYKFGEESLSEYGARGNISTVTLVRLTFRNGVFASWQTANALK